MPSAYSLSNFPNPFNPLTTIRYSLPRVCEVSLKIYNFLGQEVATLVNKIVKGPGSYEAIFNGNNLPSGTYFYNLNGSEFSKTGKMMLLR
ncbi:T9SS type A sorting domain-containing protein [Candidatus Latescibacterota bacterium]